MKVIKYIFPFFFLLWASYSFGQYHFEVKPPDNQEQIRAKHKIKRWIVKAEDNSSFTEYTCDDQGRILTCTYQTAKDAVVETITYNTAGQKQKLLMVFNSLDTNTYDYIYEPQGLKYKVSHSTTDAGVRDTTFFKYNDTGLLIEIKGKNTICSLVYDKQNRVCKSETIDNKWKLNYIREYTYNSKGWIIMEVWLQDGNKTKIFIWEYNKKGAVKEKHRIISDVVDDISNEYNSKGLIIKTINNSPDYSNAGIPKISTFTYEYFVK